MAAALARLIASVFGIGHVPWAQGTAGSLAALLAGAVLLAWLPWALPLAALAAVLAGIWSVATARATGDAGWPDPGWVVIDEVGGQWIAMLALLRPTLSGGWHRALGLLLAFALFRLLDIAKPGPVGWADRHVGPVWVMVDDVIAGLIAATLLWGLRQVLPGLLDG